MSDLMDCEDVPMHVELRHGGRRLTLEFRFSVEEYAYHLGDAARSLRAALAIMAQVSP